MSATARANLLQQLRQAMREYTLAIESRRRVRRELRNAEDRVREARRRVKLVEQAIPNNTEPSPCPACGEEIGTTAACVECSAHREFLR